MSEIKLNAVKIGVIGHFYAMTHRGHKYAEDGTLLELAEPIQQTYPGRNTICNSGFGRIFSNQAPWSQSYVMFVAGTSNAAPNQTDTVMADIVGSTANQHVSSEMIASNVDPAAGPLYRKFRFRRTFTPGNFGASPVNLARGGIVNCAGSESQAVLRTRPLLACGLYRDANGDPTTITVLPDEYLDQIWEYTEFLSDNITGTVTIDVNGVPTNFNYTIRPSAIFQDSFYDGGWGLTTASAAYMSPLFKSERNSAHNSTSYDGVRAGYRASLVSPSQRLTQAPSIVPAIAQGAATSVASQPYAIGQNYRDYVMSWAPDRGNAPGGTGSNVVQVSFVEGGVWQIMFDPPLPKDAQHQMSLTFRLAMANVS